MAEAESGRPAAQRGAEGPVIVAIGASAGGVQALRGFFTAIPPDTGAAFVVVVHLDPQRRTELPSILGGWTSMPVIQVDANEKLLANHVYVIPPDRRLQLVDHEISAAAFDEPRGHRVPIDLFLRSLAERLGEGFAVILSGAGSDGAIGARAVKEAGGIILVQDPSEAEYSSMPRSAIATGVADLVLPVHDLAIQLADLIRAKASAPAPDASRVDEELLGRILGHVRSRTGHDFSQYKRSTVLRRIARRIQVTRTFNHKDYYDLLQGSADEAQALLRDLLISVTAFFRDGEAFEALSQRALPALFDGKDPNEAIRVWVPGCATGEEAYTIAILLLEEAARRGSLPSIQVFASDLDTRALATAREGRFTAAIEADVSEERLRRFFLRDGDHYRVRQEVRDIVLFAVHDLLKDPPFSRVDLLSCRNLLIYLDRELQEQVCSTFHYALNPGGFLLLGSSEGADNPPGLFRIIDRKVRLYQTTGQAGEKLRLLPRLLGTVRPGGQAAPFGTPMSPSAALNEATLHRRALERFAPPSILVDEAQRVLHLSETAGRYIMPAGGPLSGDLADLVRPELRFELRSALHRIFEQHRSTLSLPILVRFNGAPHRVHLLVQPATEAETAQPRRALVMFIEGEAVDESLLGASPQETDESVRRLTQELELTQARLRTVREEADAANEELRAANEELQSINEEYRSTAEELETSKEELQSINEELQTVNSELKMKLEGISRAHGDLQNLMAATDFGTLFLDTDLCIKRFTDQVTRLFRLTPSDEGRPIADFAHRLDYDGLIADARAVLADLAPIRREVESDTGQWYDVRLRPYRTVEDKIDGVVITFVDVTDRLEIEEALRKSERQLQQQRRLVELSRDPIFIWDFDGGVLEWNRGSEELYGYSRDEVMGRRKQELLHTVVPGSSFDALRATLFKTGSWAGELHHKAKDGRQLIVESRLQLEVFDDQRLVLESTRDITERKRWEKQQQLLLSELTHRVKNILTVVQSIAHQTLRGSRASHEFVERFDGRLNALAKAHTLLVGTSWQGADLGELIRDQLEPYVTRDGDRLRIEGETVLLPASLATSFGLVIHELATNAAKYGALSVACGRVEVAWTVEARNPERLLTVAWKERNGPPALQPEQTGFGSALIDRGLPRAKVRRSFDTEGLTCTIELPLFKADQGDGADDPPPPA